MDAQATLSYCPLCRRHQRGPSTVCPVDGHRLLVQAAPLPEKGNVIEGRFVLLESIGQGGMAEVFRALDGLHRKECAVKLMRTAYAGDEKSIRQFFAEARTVRRLRHPNIVRIVGFGCTVDGHPFMAMELLRGWSLASVLKTHGALPPDRAVQILVQLMDALEAAHRHGVIHRDLKPENIFLVPRDDGSEQVKLLDFGIAQFRGSAALGSNEICGTPTYMSPEQVRGRPATPQTDLYAAGVLIFELLAGTTPFKGKRPVDILKCHLKTRPQRISEVMGGRGNDALDLLVARLLAKNPSQRPGSASEVADALTRIFAEVTHTRLTADARLTALGRSGGVAGAGSVVLTYSEGPDTLARRPHVTPDSAEFRAYLDLYLKPTLLEEETMAEPFSGAPAGITHGARIEFDHEHERAADAVRRADVSGPVSVVTGDLTMLHGRLVSLGEPDAGAPDLREAIAGPLERWFDGVAQAGGVVCHDVGDCFKILFGLETTGVRAARAAVEAARDLSLLVETEGIRSGFLVAAQVGISSGRVFAEGEEVTDLVAAVEGSVLDVAQRLSGVAPPGGVVLDSGSREDLGMSCRAERLALIRIRGEARSQQTWLVLSVLPEHDAAPDAVHVTGRPWVVVPDEDELRF
jgi:serine/threonine protein kinase/class 3 adenylate cyclase